VTAALALALALFAGGCGGGDDSTTAPSAATTTQGTEADSAGKDRYIAQADAICADVLDQTKELARRLEAGQLPTDLTGPAALAEGLVKPGLEIRMRQAARLRALPRPEGESQALDTYLGLFDVTDELLRVRLELGLQGEVAEPQNLELLIAELGEEQRQAAEDYGLDTCATNFTKVLIPAGTPG
jgi:hypothetical protein